MMNVLQTCHPYGVRFHVGCHFLQTWRPAGAVLLRHSFFAASAKGMAPCRYTCHS